MNSWNPPKDRSPLTNAHSQLFYRLFYPNELKGLRDNFNNTSLKNQGEAIIHQWAYNNYNNNSFHRSLLFVYLQDLLA